MLLFEVSFSVTCDECDGVDQDLMANRNYNRGRAYEYRTIRMLEATGYTAGRSAGSHGIFDVWAFNTMHIRLIQIKAGPNARMSPADREAFALLPAPANVTKELWSYSGQRGQKPLIAVL